MLFVDYRTGSHELIKPLRAAGVTVEETTLDFADVAFVGRGSHDEPIDVGIEVKKLSEAIGSMRTKRLEGHQFPGLVKTYPNHAWLLVEGQWKANAAGLVCTWKGNRRGWVAVPGSMMASEYEKRLLTLVLKGGLRYVPTNGQSDTVRFLVNLYRWWTDVDLDDHRSHLAVYDAPTLVPVSNFRAAVMKLPGVGRAASLAAELHFKGSLRRAVTANVYEWADLTTKDKKGKSRRLGEATARRIVDFCEGR